MWRLEEVLDLLRLDIQMIVNYRVCVCVCVCAGNQTWVFQEQ